jgi:hypothetical protein
MGLVRGPVNLRPCGDTGELGHGPRLEVRNQQGGQHGTDTNGHEGTRARGPTDDVRRTGAAAWGGADAWTR